LAFHCLVLKTTGPSTNSNIILSRSGPWQTRGTPPKYKPSIGKTKVVISQRATNCCQQGKARQGMAWHLPTSSTAAVALPDSAPLAALPAAVPLAGCALPAPVAAAVSAAPAPAPAAFLLSAPPAGLRSASVLGPSSASTCQGSRCDPQCDPPQGLGGSKGVTLSVTLPKGWEAAKV
jgi:hypothetical protein